MAKIKLNQDTEQMLIDDMAALTHDPYAFVLYSFEWGKGELANYDGPNEWQTGLLKDIKDGLKDITEVIRAATAAGHGVGKSALVSWLILWSLSTRENTKGIVTANTETQLRTKTWAELAKWHRLFIAKHWFKFTATAIHSVDSKNEKTWRIDAIPWSEHNTEAFAGMHNQGNRILLIFDEASAIADSIWEVAEGALTDENTEILWLCFGNPTRSSGRFFDCFHKMRHRWKGRNVDARTVPQTNKKQIQEWIDDYGVDSDFVKVRVRGEFPNTSDRQFIPTNLVDGARGKAIHESSYNFAPVIIGVDPALYGDDECVVYMRQGNASKQLATYRKIQDDFTLAGYIAKFEDEYKADAVFVDLGYGTGIVSAGRQMGRSWTLVPFGSESNDPGYLNKRAEMWGKMKDWLKAGVIPDDPILASELTSPEYYVRLNGKIQLESKDDMKKRGLASPNRADALALTFSFPVQRKDRIQSQQSRRSEYDPFK